MQNGSLLSSFRVRKAFSLGGGLGLLFYLDYRPTHDVDAWWSSDATGEERRQVVALLEETLGSFGAVKTAPGAT